MDKNNVKNNIDEAINYIKKYLDSCIEQDVKYQKKANLLSYWLKDYTRYLEQEDSFDSASLKSYEYGDVIKANLGFNVGNEEGGLHYCVVLDKKNSKSYSTLTVIPLTSLKPHSKIHRTSVLLGNELKAKISNKAKAVLDSIDQEKAISYQEKTFKVLRGDSKYLEKITEEERLAAIDFKEKLPIIEKILDEAEQMKQGSIALVNQITTISKQRIYNPKHDFDVLAGVKISDEKMKLISEKIQKLFINFV